MMISTRGRYALRVMIDLAQHEQEGYIPLKDIAQRQDISKKYLEILMKELVKGKLISGRGGHGGGYRLNRPAQEYIVGEILERMEGSLAPVACLMADSPICPRKENCRTLPLWKEFDQMVHDFFYSKRLSDLLEEEAEDSLQD